jgi:hypothetical protein
MRNGEIYELRGGLEIVDLIKMKVTAICLELRVDLHSTGHEVNND